MLLNELKITNSELQEIEAVSSYFARVNLAEYARINEAKLLTKEYRFFPILPIKVN